VGMGFRVGGWFFGGSVRLLLGVSPPRFFVVLDLLYSNKFRWICGAGRRMSRSIYVTFDLCHLVFLLYLGALMVFLSVVAAPRVVLLVCVVWS